MKWLWTLAFGVVVCAAVYFWVSQKPTGAPGASSREMEAWRAVAKGALLVDVRTPGEFQQGHLEGALNIPHDQILNHVEELGGDKDRSIVLYCRTGNRSGQAEKALKDNGFTHVLNGGGYRDLLKARPDVSP